MYPWFCTSTVRFQIAEGFLCIADITFSEIKYDTWESEIVSSAMNCLSAMDCLFGFFPHLLDIFEPMWLFDVKNSALNTDTKHSLIDLWMLEDFGYSFFFFFFPRSERNFHSLHRNPEINIFYYFTDFICFNFLTSAAKWL